MQETYDVRGHGLTWTAPVYADGGRAECRLYLYAHRHGICKYGSDSIGGLGISLQKTESRAQDTQTIVSGSRLQAQRQPVAQRENCL